MSDINSLLDQNEQKAQTLSLEADQALSAIGKVTELVTSFNSTIDSASQQAQQQFIALNTKLTEIEQHFIQEVQASKTNFDTLQQKLQEMDHRVDAAGQELKAQLTDLKTHVEQTTAEVDHDIQTAQSSLAQITQQVQNLEGGLSNSATTAEHDITNFSHTIDIAKQSFTEHQVLLIQHFDSLEQNTKTKLESLLSDFTALEHHNEQTLSELNNSIDAHLQDVLSSLNQKFAQEVPGELSNSSQAVNSALSNIQSIGLDKLELMDGKFSTVLDEVDKFIKIYEDIKPVLDEIKRFT